MLRVEGRLHFRQDSSCFIDGNTFILKINTNNTHDRLQLDTDSRGVEPHPLRTICFQNSAGTRPRLPSLQAAGGNRTRNLFLTKEVLFRLSYNSKLDPEGIEPPPSGLQPIVHPLHLGSFIFMIRVGFEPTTSTMSR